MSGAQLPALFVSHGAPTLPLDVQHPTHAFLKGLGATLPAPKAILVISAHWDTRHPTLTTSASPETIHDFYGFPEELYRMRYPAPGSMDLVQATAKRLEGAGLEVHADEARGLDHGAWVPLLLMYPKAQIPVVQLSLQTSAGAAHHLAVGQALAPLRDEGVLLLASGGATHNLREFFRPAPGQDESYVPRFSSWLKDTLEKGDTASLVDYRRLAPDAARAHPSEEHFFPVLVAAGAAGKGERIHTAMSGASLSMDAYKFA
ncbi:MAG TPA: class III extradiol ring-cleavage dioxygenase [Gammaproteobacteria bacterium]|jgi:4,5-DOPA dioxygenase extradiol